MVLYLAKVQSEPHLIRIILALAYSGYHLKVLIKCLKKSKNKTVAKTKFLTADLPEQNHLPQSAASPFLPRLVGHMGITFEQ